MKKIRLITGATFLVLFLCVAVKLVQVARLADYDTYEGFNALLQGAFPESPQAPFSTLAGGRTLLLLISFLQSVSQAFLHRPLTLAELHTFMVGVSLACVLGWVAVGIRLLGQSWGWLLGILLLLDRVFISESFFLQADILGSLCWALMVLALSYLLEELQSGRARSRLFLFSLALGLLGGAAATAKPHYVWLGPALILAMWAVFLWELRPGAVDRKMFWDRVVVTIAFCIVYTAAVGLSYRIYGGPGLGFLAHLRELREIYEWGVENWGRTSYWVYTRYLWGSYGPLFWGIVAISAAVAIRSRTELSQRWLALSQWRRASLVCLGLVATAYIYVTQSFSYREERYLFAFLPFILVVCTALMATLLEIRMSGAKAVWAGILAVILILPARNVRTELSTLADRVSLPERAQRQAFWKYLDADSATPKCERIRACAFFHSGVHFHVPHYFYQTGKTAEVTHCDFTAKLPQQIASRTEPGDCVVLPSAYHVEDVPNGGVVVRKILLSRGSSADANKLKAAPSAEALNCEAEDSGTTCFTTRKFFAAPSDPNRIASNQVLTDR